MANAGRVAIVPKGDYSSSVTYKRLDLVRYNDKAYVAKKASTNIVPTNTEYWMLLTSDGVTIDNALSDTSTNPVQNKAVTKAIKDIQTTSYLKIANAPGWYRVAEYSGNEMAIKGVSGNGCLISIKEIVWSTVNSERLIKLSSAFNKQEFNVISSIGSSDTTSTVTAIRYTYDVSNSKAYIEVYNSSDRTMDLFITLLLQEDKMSKWQAITPTLTEETVDGVTVTTTYDIPANASPATDLDLAQVNGTKTLSTSVLEKALEVKTGVHIYKLSGASYTGNDLLGGSYQYGYAYILKRFDNSIRVILFGGSIKDTIAINSYVDSRWQGWQTLTTTADLTTALADYLPNSGGYTSGEIGAGDTTKEQAYTIGLRNKNRYIASQILADGTYQLVDVLTQNKIVKSTADGTNTFNGTASGNLPLDGGGTVGLTKWDGLVIKRKNSVASDGLFSGIMFAHDDGMVGGIGYERDVPILMTPQGTVKGTLLHTGNSAKSHIGTTAPSDTASIWIDTANKIIKAYIDGAWTQVS